MLHATNYFMCGESTVVFGWEGTGRHAQRDNKNDDAIAHKIERGFMLCVIKYCNSTTTLIECDVTHFFLRITANKTILSQK